MRIVNAILTLAGRGSVWGRKPPEPPKVNYDDFRGFVTQSCQLICQANVKANGRTPAKHNGTNGFLDKTFGGFIQGSSNGWDGKYLTSIVRVGEKAKFVLTGIEDPDLLNRELGNGDLEARAEYELKGSDLPTSEEGVNGFHLLIEAGGRTAAVVLHTKSDSFSKDKGLLDKVLGELTSPPDGENKYDSDMQSGPALARWFAGHSKYASYASKDFGGPLVC